MVVEGKKANSKQIIAHGSEKKVVVLPKVLFTVCFGNY